MVVLIRSKAMYPCPPHMGKHSWSHKQGGPVPSELRSRLPQPAWAELLGTIQGQHGNQALANYMMRANLLAACFGVLIIVVMSIVYAPLILPFLIVEAVIWAVMVRRADKRLHPHRCAALANELSPSYESQYGVSIRWDASQNGFRVESTVAGAAMRPVPPPPPVAPAGHELVELVVPRGAAAGGQLIIAVPDGRQLAITVPDNARPGTRIHIAVPPASAPAQTSAEARHGAAPTPSAPPAPFTSQPSGSVTPSGTLNAEPPIVQTASASIAPDEPNAPAGLGALARNALALAGVGREAPRSMATVDVEVPAGGVPGQVLQVQAPSGRVVSVVIPPGHRPGSIFTAMVPAR